ncbi:MAG: CRTAC1 family protein [Acidobacteriota bacterium]
MIHQRGERSAGRRHRRPASSGLRAWRLLIAWSAAWLLTSGMAAWNSSLTPSIAFVEVGREAGLNFEHHAGGPDKDFLIESVGSAVALFDYDNDGWIDIFLVDGATLEELANPAAHKGGARLFRNLGNLRFEDVTDRARLHNRAWGMGAAAADFDNDGWTDLYVTNYGSNVLFHNNGDGTFSDVTARAGVGGGNWSTGAAWGDYDGDGDLDLYVARYVNFDPSLTPTKGANPTCRYRGVPVSCGPRGLPGLADILYRNNGDGTFTDVTATAGIKDPGYYGFTVLWLDYNRDGKADIFVANDGTPNFLFRNNGNGTFEQVGPVVGVSYSEDGLEQSCMGAAAGDVDNDGRLDLFVTNFADDTNTLYRSEGQESFSDSTIRAGLAGKSWLELGWGTGLIDFDNDGWRDIFVANGHIYPEVARLRMDTQYLQRCQLFQNTASGRFVEVSSRVGPDFAVPRSARGVGFADLDNDGDIDIVLNNLDARPSLLRNDRNNANHWLSLQLQGTQSNRDAFGALVTAEGPTRTLTAQVSVSDGYLGTSDKRILLGLGADTEVERLTILWPSSRKQILTSVRAGRRLVIKEGSDGPGPSGVTEP